MKYLYKVGKLAGFLVVLFFINVLIQYISLPSDSEMMSFFKENRSALEELVEVVHNSRRASVNLDAELQVEVNKLRENLYKDLGVSSANTGVAWSSQPYSKDRSKMVERIIRSEELIPYFEVSIWPYDGVSHSFFWGQLVKEYFFIPVNQRFNDGWMLAPTDPQGNIKKLYRISNSLDWFLVHPLGWYFSQKGYSYCMVRPIEPPHWFIRFCKSAGVI